MWRSLWLVLCLCACGHVVSDGAPSDLPRNWRTIPEPRPWREPLIHSANPKSYVVNGHRYYVQQRLRSFRQVGVASWYGTKFRHHLTSSGESYHLFALTAAHKTLPIPSYVRVYNLENGRSIVVRVNDRGPFAPNRIIDLSFLAAKRLGMLRKGTARVRIETILPGHRIHAPSVSSHRKACYLQFGHYQTIAAAKTARSQLPRVWALKIAAWRGSYLLLRGPFPAVNARHMQTHLLDSYPGIWVHCLEVSVLKGRY